MEAMRQSWTDDRLDDLSRRMDERFDHVEGEMKAGFERVDARFERIDARFGRVGREIGACEVQLAEIKASQDLIREAIAELHADNRQLHADMYALQRTIVRIGFGLVFSLVAVLSLLVANS